MNDTQPTQRTNGEITNWIKQAVEAIMTKKVITRHPFELSQTTLNKLEEKRNLLQNQGTEDAIKQARKEVTRSVRKDKRQYTANMVSHEIDERDQYMGLRNLRRPFVATPLGMKDKDGQHIPFEQRSQKAAEFLGTVFWGASVEAQEHTQPRTQPQSRIVSEDLGMDLQDITMKELFWAINKLKRAKAAGPDNLPLDCYKEMDVHQLQLVLDLVNDCWNGAPMPTEYTQAR